MVDRPRNDGVITVISVAIELVIGMALALVMHRALVGRGLVRTTILVPYGIITVVAALAWKFAFTPGTGFVNEWLGTDRAWLTERGTSLFVIIATEVWKTTPFMALLLLAGLALVPDNLIQAAKVDGATTFQAFRKVTLPLMKGAILVALLFRTLDSFRIFDTIFIQTQGANDTESVSILGYNQLLNRLNLGIGSAISVLIFLCVVIIAFVFVKGFGANLAQQRGGSVMHGQLSRKVLWIGVPHRRRRVRAPPLRVDRLAVAETARPTSPTARFIPRSFTWDNYSNIFDQSVFTSALRNSIGIALISTLIAVVLATTTAYAIARLDFPGKRFVLGCRARHRDLPADLDHQPAVRDLAAHRPLRHVARADHPVPHVHTPAFHLASLGVLPPDPVGAGASRGSRRRHAVPGVPARHRAARRARHVHRRDPRVHLRVERLPVRDLADVDRPGADRAGGDRLLPGQLAVPAAHRDRSRRPPWSSPCPSSSRS